MLTQCRRNVQLQPVIHGSTIAHRYVFFVIYRYTLFFQPTYIFTHLPTHYLTNCD